MAPRLGLKPTQPQKLAGRRIEPSTWVPRPAAIMPLAVAAAEPEDEPPGVRRISQGLRVGPGGAVANSVVTVLPRITAPASRSAVTEAASRRLCQPLKKAEPFSVGKSRVSMMSLTPTGMPSIGERGLPAFQRAVDCAASARAPSAL